MHLRFEPIRLDQYDDYRTKLSQCGQIASDYSFINLWGWGPEYDLQWAWDDHLVWLRQSKPIEAIWAPVGDWSRLDWPSVVKTVRTIGTQIIRVPEALVSIWRQSGQASLQTTETREHWDYLYSIEELTELKGNRFHKKKNLVRQFEKNYLNTYLELGPAMIEQALAMQEDWCTWRDCESNDTLAAENQAISRILRDCDRLPGIVGGALQVEGSLAAYTIGEVLPDNSLVIHFEKGSPDHKGSYQAINKMFLAHAPAGCTLVNREQDLGDEGLRQAKLSYHPVDFIRKYQVIVE